MWAGARRPGPCRCTRRAAVGTHPRASEQCGGPPAGGQLLHLDLHPFNILVDEHDEVSGVIDWANASAGHPDLDLARTASIFRWDPAAVAQMVDPARAALVEGWTEVGGLSEIPATAMAWAGQYMLADLGPRYEEDGLAEVHRALGELTN